jgi:2-polyprenyl-3-methyl-5-hydroxy-6-metoxy-1,4-benzoquinol methylase
MKAIDVYGLAAEQLSSATLISGRLACQAESEQHISADVIAKMGLNGTGTLLEIGCGVGTLLTPLARCVSKAIGIDHPSCIAKYRELGVAPNVSLFSGEWPCATVPVPVDWLLCYSVLHCLRDAQAAMHFIRACLEALRPGGTLLIGDLPNVDKRQRFLASAFGKRFHADWMAQTADQSRVLHRDAMAREEIFAQLDRSAPPFISDAFVLRVLTEARNEGHESYLLSQPTQLPFSFTREDVIIRKRAAP